MQSSRRRWLAASTLAPFCLTMGLAGSAAGAMLNPGLEAELVDLPDDGQISVIVHLAEQVDVESINRTLRLEQQPRRVRHESVISALKELADLTQPALLTHLEGAMASGQVQGYTPHWISNLVVVKATKAEVERLAHRADVELIEPNFTVSLIEPVSKGEPGDEGIGVTPGLKAINADRVWREFGITGAGRLVADLDTGVDGNHPALADRWRGLRPDVHWSEAWLDLVYGGSQFPADYYGHGTHVMGTMAGLGEATGDTVGVAFNAEWIACNAIDQSVNPGFDNDVVAAFEWLADPDGDPGTVDDVPDVVQNSWGINEGFGGDPPYTDCDSRWWAVIDNCEAAGCVVTFSAGNEGPGPQSHRSPADRASSPYNCYSIGAVDATNHSYPYPIASFSSRGPSGCDDVSIKPEVSAPGVDVYSCVPGGGYSGSWSGTSMAGPHVAGVVALMREANAELSVNQIKEVLMATSHDFGDVGEDNTYGRGFIDAYEAVLMVMEGVGYLTGTVTDAGGGNPVPAELQVVGTQRLAYADPVSGKYQFYLPGDSTYTIEASYFGYEDLQQMIYVVPDDTTTLDFTLELAPSGRLAGMVSDVESGMPVAGAVVEVLDTPIEPITTNALGVFNFPIVPAGSTYTLRATAGGFGPAEGERMVAAGALNLLALPVSSGISDDMESGENGWTHYFVTPSYSDQWHQSIQRNHTVGGTTAWKCGDTGGGDYADLLDAALETPTLPLRSNSILSFWHWMDAEIGGGAEAWDGGFVEISVNGGAFQQITPVGGYPYTIIDNPDSPFAPGTPCYSGTHDWKQEFFDLSAYSGNVAIRFRFGSDGYVTEEGWFIDDLVVAPLAESQAVSALLLPTNPDIVIGPEGGSFRYRLGLVNNTAQSQSFDWWIDANEADGPLVFGPFETHAETLSPGEAKTFLGLARTVPPGTRPGDYHYNLKVGDLPDQVDAIASFGLTITE